MDSQFPSSAAPNPPQNCALAFLPDAEAWVYQGVHGAPYLHLGAGTNPPFGKLAAIGRYWGLASAGTGTRFLHGITRNWKGAPIGRRCEVKGV